MANLDRAITLINTLGNKEFTTAEARAYGDLWVHHFASEAKAIFAVDDLATLTDDQVAGFVIKKVKDHSKDIMTAAAASMARAQTQAVIDQAAAQAAALVTDEIL